MGFIGILILVFILAWWATGRLCESGSKLILLDHPNTRSLHTVPTPRTGGLAIMGSFLVGVALIAFSGTISTETGGVSFLQGWQWIVGMTVLVAGISFLDDRRGVPVWLRLIVHVLAATGVVVMGGTVLSTVPLPTIGVIKLGWLAPAVSVMFVVWMANLYNFMDGMDGFAAGMAVVGGGCLALFYSAGQQESLAALPLLLAGASGGFLIHNFPSARIFMGDVGSVPIGFLFGALSLWGCRESIFDIWVPILVFSPFIIDATVTLCRRSLRRENVWEAHRSHYYQRLVLLGWGHRRTVLAEYALMFGCAVSAVLYQFGTEHVRAVVLMVWCTVLISIMAAVELAERMVGRGK